MKTKLFLVLTAITLTFQACSSSDDDTINDPIIAACETPINLSATSITENSAVLNWDNPNTNSDVTVEYGPSGFTLGTGTIISTSQNSISINNLMSSTSYDFYVQAICAANNMSSQSSVASFTSDEMPECVTPTNISVTEIKAISVDLSWNNPNTNLEVEVEFGPTGFTTGTGTVIYTSQNSISITGLTPSTTYDCYVQAICAATNMSPQSQVTSFTTTVASPFAGTWNGTYEGDDTGTWVIVYSENGEFVSGSTYSNNLNQTIQTISGSVTADGVTNSVSANGSTATGQITGENIVGTWINPNQGNINGTYTGSRE